MSALSNITVTRHVTILPGGTFSAGAGLAHSVGGSWTSSGSFDCGTSTVTMSGASSQVIGGSTFYRLVVDDTAGVTLSGNVSVCNGGALTLTRGNLNTGAYTLAINSSSASALMLGANRIIGTVTRAIAPGSTSTYQFFDANSFVLPNGDGNPTSVTATVYPNTNPPNLPAQADTTLVVKRYVRMSAIGAGANFAYTLRLSFAKAEVRGPEISYVLWKTSAGAWQNVGASTVDTTSHFVQQSGLTGFGDVTAADPAGALPIELLSFGASMVPKSNNLKLSWTTATEVNNYGFFVQRSVSATDGFVDLPNNFVRGNGTTLTPQNYEWIDTDVSGGPYFYRLKQVDLDGSIAFYGPIKGAASIETGSENVGGPLSFALDQNWPNPFNPATTISFQVPSAASVSLKVYDLVGREVATLVHEAKPAGMYTVRFDGTGLASGTYIYRMEAGNFVATKKLVLIR
jgi:hypothetical protein